MKIGRCYERFSRVDVSIPQEIELSESLSRSIVATADHTGFFISSAASLFLALALRVVKQTFAKWPGFPQ